MLAAASLTCGVTARSACAQANLPSAVRRDSLGPDTLFGMPVVAPARSSWRQAIYLRGVVRWYDVGSPAGIGRYIDERAGAFTYQVRGPRFAARLDANPLTYETTQAGVTTNLAGLTPVSVRLEWRWAPGDTSRLFARGATTPRTLDSTQTAAIGAAGTSTVELDAVSLGAPAAIGIRQTYGISLGDVWSLSLRGSVETSERPGGSLSVFWTGNTVRAGAAVIGLWPSSARIIGSVDVSRSFADSLGGRNLFPGGGTVMLDVRAQGPLDGSDGRFFGQAQTFFSRPYGNTRADQPNRLIPQGDFFGANTTVSAEVGPVLIVPTVSTVVEIGRAQARRLFARSQFRGLGWSVAGSLAVIIPLSRYVDITPEIGLLGGNVSQEYLATTINPLTGVERTVLQASYQYPTKGRVLTLEMAIRF
jgi:hypothetical protein